MRKQAGQNSTVFMKSGLVASEAGQAAIAANRLSESIAAIVELVTQAYAESCAVYVQGRGDAPVAFSSSVPEAGRRLRARPFDAQYVAVAAESGLEHVEAVPFSTDADIAGTVVFGFSTSSRAHAAALRSAVNGIAKSLEQASLLDHHWAISNRLQRALLPGSFPVVDMLRIDPAYRAATSESVVGGDWYDVFEISNGIYGVSIGDVTGHGLEAAVAMSEIRRAIRAAAATASSPTDLLNYVDAYMVSQNVGMATAIAGFYDSSTCTLRYAAAGHPQPVHLGPTGRATFLPAGGLLLGVGMEPASQEWTITLGPKSSVYFYTDGLLEYSRDVIEGEKRLLEAVEALGSRNSRSAEGLLDRVFVQTQNSDDTAALLLDREARCPDQVTLTFSAVPHNAVLVRDALRYFMACKRIPDERVLDVLTGVGEAVANAVEHGSNRSGTFTLTAATPSRGTLQISVRSEGHWRAFTPRDERGRGIPIMRAYATSMNIESVTDSTTITLSFEGLK